MNYQSLGKKVRECRKRKQLTQEQLAEIVDISPSFLGHIERGSRVASLETFARLCNALEVSPHYLLSAELLRMDEIDQENLALTKEKLLRLFELAIDILSHNVL